MKGTDGIVGNHGNKLENGDFAASTDVQAQLKANGAKAGDPVLIHLADGDTILARFNDSTAQDAQRKDAGKSALHGRFDVWTSTKGHQKDGVAVHIGRKRDNPLLAFVINSRTYLLNRSRKCYDLRTHYPRAKPTAKTCESSAKEPGTRPAGANRAYSSRLR